MNTMKRFIMLIGLLSVYSIISASQPYLPNTIVIKFKSISQLKSTQVLPTSVNAILSKSYTNIQPMFPEHSTLKSTGSGLNKIYMVTLTNENGFWEKINQLNEDANVEYALPYYLPELLGEINDPLVSNQYYLDLIQADTAHSVNKGDTSIIIGITDTGVELLHDDLKGNIKYNYDDPINGIDDDADGFIDNYRGWDVADNDNNPSESSSYHGTMVAGLASASCNNEIGIYSIGYNSKILPVKIMDSNGYLSGAYQGIVYAADHGCDVINCSWGSQIDNQLLDEVIDYAISIKNCVVVAAAGNASNDQPYYPGACEGVINVANTNQSDAKVSKSTYGVEVDICAPGNQVYTTYINNTYHQGWGTSFASPIVAGAAALVKAQFPDYSPLQIAEQLRITSDIIDTLTDNSYFYHHMGYGRLNAYKALTIDTLPSIRLSNLELIGPNSTPQAGDTLTVYFTATNYLAQISNTVIQLTSDSEYITTLTHTMSTGNLATLGSVNNEAKPFQIIISEDIPYDTEIELNFNIAGYSYSDYQIFKTLINPSYVNVEKQSLTTTFTSNGKIGFANSQEYFGKGVIYQNSESILPEAGIIIGNEQSTLVSAVYEEYDFEVVQQIDTVTMDGYLYGKTEFRPGDKYESMPVNILQTYRMFDREDLDGVIFYDYQIANEGSSDIDGFVFSIFTDWDIDNNYFNHSGYIKDQNIFYTYATSTNNFYAGIALLNCDSCKAYTFDLISGGNGGIDITSDFSDDLKWYAMTNNRLNDNNSVDTVDIAGIISALPQDLHASDTLNYSFCLVVANSYLELVEKTNTAKAIYQTNDIDDNNLVTDAIKIYPNPTQSELNVAITDYHESELYLYNTTGKLISQFKAESKTEVIDLSKYPNGVYYLQINLNDKRYTKKIVLVK